MRTSLYLSVLLVLFAETDIYAQFQGKIYEQDNSVKVTQGTKEKKLAWCGGLNNPQYAMADLNKDGLRDLIIFQPSQADVKTFINHGTAGSPDYRYEPVYAENFPFCSYYLILKDYNGDGIEDLFEAGLTGFTVHRGYYNSGNQLCFSLYKSLYYNNLRSSSLPINADMNPGDIPAIVDVDGDGDLDFLAYYGDGYYMNWYQNTQVEDALPRDTIRIRLADKCWGKMEQSYLRTHNLGAFCDNSDLLRKTGTEGRMKRTDAGNTPCLIDMDNDGDYDVLDGHRAFNYVVYLRNGKSDYGKSVDTMVFQDTAYSSLGDTIKIAQWAAVCHIDIDQDGKRDLMVSPNSPSGSENYKCSQFYKNMGTDALPSFKFQSDTFLVDQMIDVGTGSYPFFYDYDRDGKPDLFIGNRGYFNAKTGLSTARIMYLRNTSTPGNPSFDIITDDFLSLSYYNYNSISIGIGDINNDGKDELLLGHLDGTIDYMNNTATDGTVPPIWSGMPGKLRDAGGDIIETNGAAVPLVYDISADGVPDLLIGDQSGFLYYYFNDSKTPGTTSLVYTNNQLGLVKSDPERLTSGQSTPYIGKMDNSGKDYLIMGSRSGRIYRWEGFEGGNVFSAYTRLDSAYSMILSEKSSYTSYLSAPSIADIDGDGKFEMVVGNVYGGVYFYKQTKTVSVEDPQPKPVKLQIFPNPAQNELFIGLNQTTGQNKTSIRITDMMGRIVRITGEQEMKGYVRIDIEGLSPGIYNCSLGINGNIYNATFVKQND